MANRRMMSDLFAALVVHPIRAGHGLVGERVWRPLEPVAGALGTLGASAARPLLRLAAGRQGPLERLLRFTTLVEETLGIQGTNEMLDGGTARRRVHHCPFAETLSRSPGFCTRLGRLAGETSSRGLVPGSRFEITATLSQGHPYCEYIFRLPPAAGPPRRQKARPRRRA